MAKLLIMFAAAEQNNEFNLSQRKLIISIVIVCTIFFFYFNGKFDLEFDLVIHFRTTLQFYFPLKNLFVKL